MKDYRIKEVITLTVNYLLRFNKVDENKVRECFDSVMDDFPNLNVDFNKVRKEILRRYNYQKNYMKGFEILTSLEVA